jgi:hypothetical protein
VLLLSLLTLLILIVPPGLALFNRPSLSATESRNHQVKVRVGKPHCTFDLAPTSHLSFLLHYTHTLAKQTTLATRTRHDAPHAPLPHQRPRPRQAVHRLCGVRCVVSAHPPPVSQDVPLDPDLRTLAKALPLTRCSKIRIASDGKGVDTNVKHSMVRMAYSVTLGRMHMLTLLLPEPFR